MVEVIATLCVLRQPVTEVIVVRGGEARSAVGGGGKVAAVIMLELKVESFS